MKEHKKTTKIFWIAAITAMAVLFIIMTSALVFTGRVNYQNKLALDKNKLELDKVTQDQANFQDQNYRIIEPSNDIFEVTPDYL